MDNTRATWIGLVVALGFTLASAAWRSRRRKTIFRRQLPRIYELLDLIPVPPPQGAYFRDLDASLAAYPQKLKQYRDIEQDLRGLDPAAWAFLKSEVTPLLLARDEKRGWQPLFDKLNQAKGYNYLKGLGYSRVEFIPASVVKGHRTPDLLATSGSSRALCEVKTVNISEIEANRRYTGGVGSIEAQLSDGFFKKLAYDLVEARTQMDAHDQNADTKKIVYLIVNFDDGSHEYLDLYLPQIDQFINLKNPTPGIDVIFDIKVAFYTAMS